MSINLYKKSGGYRVVDNEGDCLGDIYINKTSDNQYSFDPNPDFTFKSSTLSEIAALISKLNVGDESD